MNFYAKFILPHIFIVIPKQATKFGRIFNMNVY